MQIPYANLKWFCSNKKLNVRHLKRLKSFKVTAEESFRGCSKISILICEHVTICTTNMFICLTEVIVLSIGIKNYWYRLISQCSHLDFLISCSSFALRPRHMSWLASVRPVLFLVVTCKCIQLISSTWHLWSYWFSNYGSWPIRDCTVVKGIVPFLLFFYCIFISLVASWIWLLQ